MITSENQPKEKLCQGIGCQGCCGKNWPRIYLWVLVGILGVLGILGGVYAGIKIGRKQVTPIPAIPTVTAPSPIPTQDPTADWKTFQNNGLFFKYPAKWLIDSGKITIASPGVDSPEVVIHIITKDSTLMNECMKVDSAEKIFGVVVKRFSRVTTGAMCEGGLLDEKEIWVIPTETAYSPGISYGYSAKDNPGAEETFDQILATFKFTE